jgi:hypothetical protein
MLSQISFAHTSKARDVRNAQPIRDNDDPCCGVGVFLLPVAKQNLGSSSPQCSQWHIREESRSTVESYPI